MSFDLTRRDFIRTTGVAAAAVAALPSALAQTDQKTTVALVGGGHIHTTGFVALVKTRPDVRVKSVWDHDAARAQKRATELNSQVADDAHNNWDDPEIKAVVIFSETNRHRELVLAA